MARKPEHNSIKYLDRLAANNLITMQDYFSRLELAYNLAPDTFSEDDVDYIEKQFKTADLEFNRDLEAGGRNVLKGMNQFVSGLVEGFTTLGWAEEPETSAHAIANRLGHLIGFAPDVVASFLSLGTYMPIAAAKRAGKVGSGLTRYGLAKAGEKAPGFLRKETGPKTFALQSIPMKVADKAVDFVQDALKDSNLLTQGFMSRGIFKLPEFRSIAHQSMHLGVALAVSSWKDGPKGMVDSALHGAAAGAVFGGIGNYVNISRLMANPKTRDLGKQMIRNRTEELTKMQGYKEREQMQLIDMMARGAAGGAFQGGMATAQDLPLPEQVYEYALGTFFGATSKGAGELARTKWIFQNRIPVDANLAKVKKGLKSDAEFNKLNKADQDYIERYLDVLQVEQVNRFNALGVDFGEKFLQLAKENGIDVSNIKPGEALKQLHEAVAKKAGLDDLTEVKFNIVDDISKSNKLKPLFEESEWVRILDHWGMNKDIGEKLPELPTLDPVADIWMSLNNKADKVTRKRELNKIVEESELNYDKFLTNLKKVEPELVKKIESDHNLKREIITSMKYRKHILQLDRWEIDMTKDEPEMVKMANKSLFGDDTGGSRPRNIYNTLFGRKNVGRIIINKSYAQAVVKEQWGEYGSLQDRIVFERKNPLDYNADGDAVYRSTQKGSQPKIDGITGGDIIQPYTHLSQIKERISDEIIIKMSKDLTNSKNPHYVFSGAKDSGTLIVQAIPDAIAYNLKNPGKNAKAQETMEKEILKVLKEEKIKVEDGFERETAANVLYELYTSGLIPSLNLTELASLKSKIDVKNAIKEYIKDPQFATVQKFNKYQNLFQGANIPLDFSIFTGVKDMTGSDIYGFETAKGSKYEFSKDKRKTTRTKVDNTKGDAGLKDESIVTFYLQPNQWKEINQAWGIAKSLKGPDGRPQPFPIEPQGPGKVKFGKKIYDVETSPKLGLQPFEILPAKEGFVQHHIGNKIVKINKDAGFFNVMPVVDFQGKYELSKESGTDAVVVQRQDIYDITAKDHGYSNDTSFLKLVGASLPRNGIGNILLKTGTQRASDSLNDFMVNNNIHFIVRQTATKTQRGLQYNTLKYEKSGWKTDGLFTYKARPEEFHINLGVYESIDSIMKPQFMIKQMFDKDDPILTEAFNEAADRMRQESINGDVELSEKFRKAFKENDLTFTDYNIDEISLAAISEALEGYNVKNQFAKDLIKKIIKSNELEPLGERFDVENANQYNLNNFELPEFLNKIDWHIGGIIYPTNLEYINRSIYRYAIKRVVKPPVKYAGEGKLAARDEEIRFKFPQLNENTFMLHDGWRKFKVKVGDWASDHMAPNREMTLEKLWEHFEFLNKNKTKNAIEIQRVREDLTMAMARSPISGLSGIRVLEFAGFVKRRGYGVVTTSKTDYYLGGADKDGDAVKIFQNMPKEMMDGYKRFENQLEGIDFKDPNQFSQFIRQRTGVQGEQSPQDKMSDLFSLQSRLNVARNARIGKQNIDHIVAGVVRMQQMRNIVGDGYSAIVNYSPKWKKEFKITPLKSLKEIQLDSFNLINTMADAADFNKIGIYNDYLNDAMRSYFKIEVRTPNKKKKGEWGPWREYDPHRTVDGVKSINFYDYYKDVPLLKELNRFHQHVNDKMNKEVNIDLLKTDAKNYNEAFFNHPYKVPYYEALSKNIEEISKFQISPWEVFGENSVQIVRAITSKLRGLIQKDPIFERFGLWDTYQREIEWDINFDYLAESNPKVLWRKFHEYQGLYYALQQTKRFELAMQEQGMDAEAVRSFTKEIMDKTYDLKLAIFRNKYKTLTKDAELTDNPTEKLGNTEMGVEDINYQIAHTKRDLLTNDKYKSYRNNFEDVETLYDTWLLANPMKEIAEGDILRPLMNDVQKQYDRLSEEINSGKGNMKLIEKLMDNLGSAHNKFNPQFNPIIRSRFINHKNMHKYFVDQAMIIERGVEKLQDKIGQIPGRKFALEQHQINLKKGTEYQPIEQFYQEAIGQEPGPSPKLLENYKDIINQIESVIPGLEWVGYLKDNKQGFITFEQDKQIKRLQKIIGKNPGAIQNFESFFIDMMANQGVLYDIETGKLRRAETMTAEELTRLNDQLEVIFSAKSWGQKTKIVDRIGGSLIKKPGTKEQMLNPDIIGRDLAKFENFYYTKRVIQGIDRDGSLTALQIRLPMSTLELGRQFINLGDNLGKAQSSLDEDLVDTTFEYIVKAPKETLKHMDTLVEAAVNRVEYNIGADGNPRFARDSEGKLHSSKEEILYITESFNESAKVLKKMKDMGIKFTVDESFLTDAEIKLLESTKTGRVRLKSYLEGGKTKEVSPQYYVEKMADDMNTLTRNYYRDRVESRHERIREIVLKTKKDKENLYLYKPDIEIDINDPQAAKLMWIQQMERMLLTGEGLLNETRVKRIYKNLLLSQQDAIKKLNFEMFSINDWKWLKYQRRIKWQAENELIKENGLDDSFDIYNPVKTSNGKVNKDMVYQKVSDIRVAKKNDKGLDHDFIKETVGFIAEGYFPRNGHFLVKENIPEIEKWINDKNEKKLARIKVEADLPHAIQMKLRLREDGITDVATAKAWYKENVLDAQMEKTKGNSLTQQQYESEMQLYDIMTGNKKEFELGERTHANFQSRGDGFMPFYQKNLDAIRNYLDGGSKTWLTNVIGLRTEMALEEFSRRNQGEEFMPNWLNYMRGSFVSMMGMPTARALNLNGIQKKDQDFLRSYVKNKLDSSKMGLLDTYKKDLLYDFDIATSIGEMEQNIIWGNAKDLFSLRDQQIAYAKQKMNEARLKKAKALVEQVNTTGIYGTLSHYYSDGVATRFFDKVDGMFGGNLYGPLPKNKKARQMAKLKRIKQISDIEGKFELISLLSHPKTLLTNLYGGIQNTISDTGWEPFRKANDTDWLLAEFFGENAYYTKYNKDTKSFEREPIKTKKDIEGWLESLGVYDQMFTDMVGLDRRFGKKNQRRFWIEFITKMNKSARKGEFETQEAYNKRAKQTYRELAKEYKITTPFVEAGAWPMKWSERKLRGTAFLANAINMRFNIMGPAAKDIAFDSPVILDFAMKGVLSSQFLYQAAYRPNFANTSMGRVMTRFHPYAWNSIARRFRLYKGAEQEGWNKELLQTKQFQRQFTADMMSLALANLFVASIFEYALSPPMSWAQDTAQLLFGDKEERDRAFFSQYPSKVLAPLQIVTPPIGRFVLPPITSMLNNDYEMLRKYQVATYFPYGRLLRDSYRTYQNPAMAVDFMTGMPLHRLHSMRRAQIEEVQAQIEAETPIGDGDLSEN